MENDQGTGPIATSVSPAAPASRNELLPSGALSGEFHSASLEIAQREWPLLSFEELGDEGATAEINAEYRRKLTGLRRMRRYERAQALRAAREWKFLALKALREKRAHDRLARYALWRSRMPPPRQPG